MLSEVMEESEEQVVQRLLSYANHNLLHLNIQMDGHDINALNKALHAMQAARKAIHASKGPANPLFLSVTCPLALCSSWLAILPCRVDLIMIQVPAEYNAVASALSTQELLDKIDAHDMVGSSGACGFPSTDGLDAFMLAHRAAKKLSFVGIHITSLPNIQNMAVELAHSFQLNCLLTFNNDLLEASRQQALLCRLADKYKLSAHSVLLKCILQLGGIPALPLRHLLEQDAQLLEELERLGHPFVHRKEFVSAFRIISLQIDEEDVDALVEASDELEMLRDEQRRHMATTMPNPLPFSYT